MTCSAAATTTVESVDRAVLEAAAGAGTLVTNDQALGRRALNLGGRWLRTADLLVLCLRAGRITEDDARVGLRALAAAGRLSQPLLADYLEEL